MSGGYIVSLGEIVMATPVIFGFGAFCARLGGSGQKIRSLEARQAAAESRITAVESFKSDLATLQETSTENKETLAYLRGRIDTLYNWKARERSDHSSL